MKASSCQQFVDSKAFKGKGDAWRLLRSLGGDLRAAWRDMEALAHETATLERASAYIQVHRVPGLSKSGAVKELRWRLRQRHADSHVLWSQVERLLVGQPIAVRRYYWQLNQRMLDLNCVAGILRSSAIKLLTRLKDQTDPDGAALFKAWIKGELTLADFDLRRPSFHTEDKAE